MGNVPLIDQTLDFTASQKRDVASIKLSISRQMRGRPPVSSQTLMLGSRVLKDDEIIYDLLDEWEDEREDDDEDDDDETDGNQDPDKMVENQLAKEEEETVLPLILDIPPPIDPKFATELKEQLKLTTIHELLDAFVSNMAVLHRNTERMFQQQQLLQKLQDSREKEEEENLMEDTDASIGEDQVEEIDDEDDNDEEEEEDYETVSTTISESA